MPPKKQTRPQRQPTPRYYLSLFRKANAFRLGLDSCGWLNLWHRHFDWDGFGDRSRAHQRRHVAVLMRALNRARIESLSSTRPCQVFAIVHARGASAEDALYAHTENPHHTVFPTPLAGVPTQALPPFLAGRVDLAVYEVLVNRRPGGASYVIQPRGPLST